MSGSLEGAMDCSTQADASSNPASNVAGISSATAWYRVLFRSFASSDAAFSPRRCRVQPSVSPRVPRRGTAKILPGRALSEPGAEGDGSPFCLTGRCGTYIYLPPAGATLRNFRKFNNARAQNAGVAQLAEQLPCKQWVAGSSPVASSEERRQKRHLRRLSRGKDNSG